MLCRHDQAQVHATQLNHLPTYNTKTRMEWPTWSPWMISASQPFAPIRMAATLTALPTKLSPLKRCAVLVQTGRGRP